MKRDPARWYVNCLLVLLVAMWSLVAAGALGLWLLVT